MAHLQPKSDKQHTQDKQARENPKRKKDKTKIDQDKTKIDQ
jgi:hypothetical protein